MNGGSNFMDEHLKNLIEGYKQTDWKALLKEDLGKYHLKELQPDLNFIKDFFDFAIQNINFLNRNRQNQLCNDFLMRFQNVKNNIKSHTDTSQNQNIIGQVSNLKDIIINQGHPIFWAIDCQKKHGKTLDDPKGDIKKYKSAREEIEAELKKMKQTQSHLLQIQSQLSEQTIREEASRYGDFFNKESRKASFWAWIFGILLTLVSIGVCFLSYNFLKIDPEITVNNIPELILKGNLINNFFIFTMIILFITVLRREYLALRHQRILNKHRSNALYSHKEILSSIEKTASESDKEISNAILLELTKAMFNPQDTGFVKDQKNASSDNRIVEISKSLFNSKE